jgi:hypothetical protein
MSDTVGPGTYHGTGWTFSGSGAYTLIPTGIGIGVGAAGATVADGTVADITLGEAGLSLLSTYTITAVAGGTADIDTVLGAGNTYDFDAAGGNVTISASIVSAIGKTDATITAGGDFTAGSAFLGALTGSSVNYGTGGGTFTITGSGVLDLFTGTTINDFSTSNKDFIDSEQTSLSSVESYKVINDGTTSQEIEFFSGTGATGTVEATFVVSGHHLGLGTFNDSATSGALFVTSGVGGSLEFTPGIVCFLRGTRLATPDGEVPVEDLKVEDRVATRLNGNTVFRPVKWLGRRRIDLAAHPRPDTVMPIRIQRGAFADNVPHRDLLISPDHAVFVDGKLICARQLINRTTISQERDLASVEYFHVELDTHAILLSEGLPTESYLDTDNRGFFSNSDQARVLHPDLTDESTHTIRATASCAPFVWAEDAVRPVWNRLAERAAALGKSVAAPDGITDPGLCIVVRGQTQRPVAVADGRYQFIIKSGVEEVLLVSRAASPSHVQPWRDDRSQLGVNIERIVLRRGSDMQDIPVDHPGLSQGWWATEPDGTALRRWTDGRAKLTFAAGDRPAILEIWASNGGMMYPAEAAEQSRAA